MNIKKAAINFLINRMDEYPITHNNKNKEETIIKTMLNNNNYPQNAMQHKQNSTNKNNKQKQKRKPSPEQLLNY
jgi:hypothetical protein